MLVDVVAARADLVPCHGLSLLVEVGGSTVLFGTGPLLRVLEANMRRLGRELGEVDVLVIPMESRAVSGAAEEVAARLADYAVIVAPQGLAVRAGKRRVKRVSSLVWLSEFLAVLPPVGHRRELALVALGRRGPVLLLACSHVGSPAMIERAARELGLSEVCGVVGGLHLSAHDLLTLADLEAALARYRVKVVVPLFCTGLEAREKIIKSLRASDISSDNLGCGLECEF